MGALQNEATRPHTMHKSTPYTVGADIIRPPFPRIRKKGGQVEVSAEPTDYNIFRADDIRPYEFYRTFSSNTVVLQQAENACCFFIFKKIKNFLKNMSHIGTAAT